MSAPYGNVKVVLAFLQEHPNRTFTAEEIVASTGIRPGSLNGAFGVLKKSHPGQALKLGRGLYRWREDGKRQAKTAEPETLPLPSPASPVAPAIPESNWPEKMLVVGPTSNGELVIQSEAGELYLARKL